MNLKECGGCIPVNNQHEPGCDYEVVEGCTCNLTRMGARRKEPHATECALRLTPARV